MKYITWKDGPTPKSNCKVIDISVFEREHHNSKITHIGHVAKVTEILRFHLWLEALLETNNDHIMLRKIDANRRIVHGLKKKDCSFSIEWQYKYTND